MMAIPVAEYVRMSTEDQKYSIPSQQAAIRQYAAEHGFVVSKTYADAGKSGLLIKYRPELYQRLQECSQGVLLTGRSWSMTSAAGAGFKTPTNLQKLTGLEDFRDAVRALEQLRPDLIPAATER